VHLECDYLVIGSGIAGLSFALDVADSGRVIVVTKRDRAESNTRYAQGGIAAVLAPDDSFDAHVEDTVDAGAGLCHRDAVEATVRDGPARVRELVARGVEFTRTDPDRADSRLDLGREGGHKRRRVAHHEDLTGREIARALVAAVDAHESIEVLEDHVAIDLVTRSRLGWIGRDEVLGAYVLDQSTGRVRTMQAPVVVLATGGAGKVYLYTSNPDVATGDGLAMAYRAGCTLANLEFVQFHPTCLYHPRAKSFLVSEALRGEGGLLRKIDGERLMEGAHPMEDLAPRDIVARAIDDSLKRSGDPHVGLDMSHLDPEFLVGRFPGIHRACMGWGIDMREQPIPVVPAAHYSCGGVRTDLQGRTDVDGLFAIGEVASTGLHGANRLASNSLLEGVVFAHRAAQTAKERLAEFQAGHRSDARPEVPRWDPGDASDSDEMVVVSQNWEEIRRFMWNYVGIVRTTRRLERALRRIRMIREEIQQYYWDFVVTSDLVELRNIATVAELIIECALLRKESRGLHYTLDHPVPKDDVWLRDTLIRRGEGPRRGPRIRS
jgi:L-aspartate oxidase